MDGFGIYERIRNLCADLECMCGFKICEDLKFGYTIGEFANLKFEFIYEFKIRI